MAYNYGIKVSQEGYDVKDESAGSVNLLFDTNSNTLKEQFTGDKLEQESFTHSLGYVPIFLVYDSNSLNGKRRISTTSYATTSKIDMGLGGQYDEYRYFIFYNE